MKTFQIDTGYHLSEMMIQDAVQDAFPDCAVDVQEVPSAEDLISALQEVVKVLESNPSSITDTVWVTGNSPETLLDRCKAVLEASKREGNKWGKITLREEHQIKIGGIVENPCREALVNLLDHYVALVNSGDAGNWNPEEELCVKAARKALSNSNSNA